jgi:hypothetical protein
MLLAPRVPRPADNAPHPHWQTTRPPATPICGRRTRIVCSVKAGSGNDAIPARSVISSSNLIERVTSSDPIEVMPPPKHGKPLSPEQVKLLVRWVEEGAEWQDHWAFLPPELPSPPTVKQSDWPVQTIDQFLLARMEKAGLEPMPDADPATLLRRVTFDLTGPAPTPEEVDAFLADASPQAYERVVDRLLGSPHYGERMAVNWLDLARYADTSGYHFDGVRFMWLWRDWVIRAFNENKPYDTFTIEQLAGDLLPNPPATNASPPASSAIT